MATTNNYKVSVEAPDETKLTDWENPPTLEELKQDFTEAQSSHTAHVTAVDNWIKALNGEQGVLRLYLNLYVSKLNGVMLH